MSDLQKLGALVALCVGLVSLGTGIWKASAFFTAMDAKLDIAVQAAQEHTEELDRRGVFIQEAKISHKQLHEEMDHTVGYVYTKESSVVLKSPKGEMLEVPLLGKKKPNEDG